MHSNIGDACVKLSILLIFAAGFRIKNNQYSRRTVSLLSRMVGRGPGNNSDRVTRRQFTEFTAGALRRGFRKPLTPRCCGGAALVGARARVMPGRCAVHSDGEIARSADTVKAATLNWVQLTFGRQTHCASSPV